MLQQVINRRDLQAGNVKQFFGAANLDLYARMNGNAIDEGMNNLAIVNNNATPAPGFINSGYTFSANKYISYGNYLAYERTQAFTIMAWFYRCSNANGYAISKLTSSSPYRGFALYYSGTSLLFELANNTGSNYIRVNSPANSLQSGRLYHVVSTYDGSSTGAGVSLFINGQGQDCAILANSLSLTTIGTAALEIGNRSAGEVAYYWNAPINNVAIFNRELTPAEIGEYYAWSIGYPVRRLWAVPSSSLLPDMRSVNRRIFTGRAA